VKNIKKLIFVLLVLFLASCAPADQYCPRRETNKMINDLNQIDRKWTVAFNIAGKTEKANLESAIQGLITLKQEAEMIEETECLESAKQALIAYMEKIIDGFTAIRSGKSESTVEGIFDSSDEYLDDYYTQVLEIQKCLPNCKKPN